MTRVITVAIHKGGTAKTTTAAALAAGLAFKGKSVLTIDLDSQGHLSYTFGAKTDRNTVFGVLTDGADAGAAIQYTPSGDIIAASPKLAGIDGVLSDKYALRSALRPLRDRYDYIIIDTAPARSILTVNALAASDGYIIPTNAETYALMSVREIITTADNVRLRDNPSLELLGILVTRYEGTVLERQILTKLQEEADKLGTQVFQPVRKNIALSEAALSGQSIYDYAPKSTGAAAYTHLVEDIIKKE